MNQDGRIIIVEDDPSERRSLRELLQSVKLSVETFENAEEFLEGYIDDGPACLVLDVRMPGMSGLELQDRLKKTGLHLPTVFLSGYGDIPMAVEAIQKGASNFIEKPFRAQELLDSVHEALIQAREMWTRKARAKLIGERFQQLTPREREVMRMTAEGLTAKEIAARLTISPKTARIHRAKAMAKMDAETLVEFARLYYRLDADSHTD